MAYKKQAHTLGVANQKNNPTSIRTETILAAGAAVSFVGGLATLIAAIATSPGTSHGNAILRLEDSVPIDAPKRGALIHAMQNWECATVGPSGAFTQYETRHPDVFNDSKSQNILHETQAICATPNTEPVESLLIGLGGAALAIGGPVSCTIIASRRSDEQLVIQDITDAAGVSGYTE